MVAGGGDGCVVDVLPVSRPALAAETAEAGCGEEDTGCAPATADADAAELNDDGALARQLMQLSAKLFLHMAHTRVCTSQDHTATVSHCCAVILHGMRDVTTEPASPPLLVGSVTGRLDDAADADIVDDSDAVADRGPMPSLDASRAFSRWPSSARPP